MKSLMSLALNQPKVVHTVQMIRSSAFWIQSVMLLLSFMTMGAITQAKPVFAADSIGSGYSSNDVRRIQNVITGRVQDMRQVSVQNTSWGAGQVGSAAIGSVVGGLIGQSVGNGSTRAGATAVLALVGGAVGYKVNDLLSEGKGVEFIVNLDDGRTIAITQGLDTETNAINVGDRVRLIQGSSVRVARLID